MFPLQTVLFPHGALRLHVFEPRYQALVAHCLGAPDDFGIVLISRGSEVGGGDERVSLGTISRIEAASPEGDGRWTMLARGLFRVRVAEWLPDDPYPVARVDELRPGPGSGATVAPETLAAALAAVRRVRALLCEAGQGAAVPADLHLDEDPEVAAWQVCALAALNPLDQQRLLETDDPSARLAELIALSGALADDVSRLLAGGM